MNSEKRKVLSYCMALLLAFTTIFSGGGIANAATLDNNGTKITTSNEYFKVTTKEGQTIYTLNKDVKDGLNLTLENGESAILEGNGHTIDGKNGYFNSAADGTITENDATPALTVSGSGTLTIKYTNLNGGDDLNSDGTGVLVNEGCNLILDETVTMKGRKYGSTGDDLGLEFSGNRLVMKENSNITIGERVDDRAMRFNGHFLDVEDNVTLKTGFFYLSHGSNKSKNQIISKKTNESNLIVLNLTNLTIKSVSNGKQLKEEKYWQYSDAIYKVDQLPVINDTKYKLEGWYTDADMKNPLKDGTKTTNGMTIYANYQQTVDVTFQSNGGSQVAKQQVKSGEKVQKPTNPTRSGYTFKGWYKDAGCTSAYDFNASVNEDMTLYAKWEKTSPVTVKKSITKATVSKIKSVTYSGFYKKPSVTVKYAGKKLKNGSDYTLSYKNNKKVGKATVTIKGKGNYTGTKKVTFKIKTRKKGVYAKGIYKVDVGGLAGHKKASSKSKVIIHYPKGRKLEVTKVIRKKTPKKTYVWLKVKYKGKTSYIYGKYVK
ncbi:MAG: InlB B-repeat-containing protein [Anaerostipes sp.]|nr:InlB B-repeat-containing protein [Anaerostipes sp.]